MRSKPRPEQLYISGTEPIRDKELDEMVALSRIATQDAKHAAELARMRKDAMIAALVEKGHTKYPFFDEEGRRKIMLIKTKHVANETKAPKETVHVRDDEPTSNHPVDAVAPSAKEHSDPFGRVRRSADGASSVLDRMAKAQDEAAQR